MAPASVWLILAAIAVMAGILKFVFASSLLPSLIKRAWSCLQDWCYEYRFYRIPELNENLQENELYRKVSVYVSSLPSLEDSNFANLVSGQRSNEIAVCLEPGQLACDSFLGASLSWRREESRVGATRCDSFVLRIRKRDKDRVLRSYFQHIASVAGEVEGKKTKEVRLFTSTGEEGGRRWRAVPFTHPASFETLAMDPELKTKLRSDLETFLKSKQYYHRLGRVWKRSYLLHGPAGTGKTSFVAAMARLLGYDVYDVDLARVADESELKSLLMQTAPRSLVLVEDLDRFLNNNRAVNVSGLLGFADGVWSSCGEGRVMVFTAGSRAGIDPVMLRPGRVDVHVYFPLCDYPAFRALAGSYLGLKDHKLFPYVEEVFQQAGSKLSPAEVGEILMVNRSSPSRALKTVINALQERGGAGKAVGERVTEAELAAARAEWGGGRAGREFRRLYGLLRKGSATEAVQERF